MISSRQAAWFARAGVLLSYALVLGCSDFDANQGVDAVSSKVSREPRDPIAQNAPLPSEQRPDVAARPLDADDWFEEVSDRAGIDFAYRDGHEAALYTLIEQIGGGVAVLDYNDDGKQDLFFAGGGRLTANPIEIHGRSCRLFRNEGNWRFTDVSQTAGITHDRLYTHGCSAADYDRDGRTDLFVAGYGGCYLYHNDGQGRFTEMAEAAGLNCPGWNVTGTWADYDGDGWLDLFVATYVDWKPDEQRRCYSGKLRDGCNPNDFPGTRNYLFRNRRDGSFEDVSERAGLRDGTRSLAALAADFDGDQQIDFFVANDGQDNDLYFGRPKLPLDSLAAQAGVAISPEGRREGSMGVAAADYNGDGRLDLFYTNYALENNSLLRNTGPQVFLNVTAASGDVMRSTRWVGFGTAFVDFDSDTWPDLVVTNGHVLYGDPAPFYQPAELLRNVQGERFEEVTKRGGPYFSVPHVGRGLAVADLDNNGAPDLVIVHQSDPVAVLRNRFPPEHWIRLRLQGTTSNREAIGAKLELDLPRRAITRWVTSGDGYVSQSDSRVLVPLTEPSPVDVTVTWPAGQTEAFRGLAPGQTHLLVEGNANHE